MPSRLGCPNKATARAREAFATFVDDTFDEFRRWVERVARKDPKGAADLYLRAAEYHIPKLARTELTGMDGAPLIPADRKDVLLRRLERLIEAEQSPEHGNGVNAQA